MSLALFKLSCIGSSSSSGIGTANLSAMAAAAALQRLAANQGSSAALSRRLLPNTNSSASGGRFHSISEPQPDGPAASLSAPQAAALSIPSPPAARVTWDSLGRFQDPSDTRTSPSTVASIKQQFVLPGSFCTTGDSSLISRGINGFPTFPEASAAERHGHSLWSSAMLLPRSAAAAATAAAAPSAASAVPAHASSLIPMRVAHSAGSPTAPTTTPAASKLATAGGAAAVADPHRGASSAAAAAVSTADGVSGNSGRGTATDDWKPNTNTETPHMATHNGSPGQYWRGAGSSSPGQYWRISRKKLFREDGTEWPWHCFAPSDTYRSDTGIDLNKHFKARDFGDTFARYLVKSLRVPTDVFFQRRYGCRAMMLETVAAVPGMVAGMLLHLRSLRMLEHSGGWIKALLEEAENERMHLMTFMEVAKPRWYERALIFSVQAVFFTAYTAAYVLSPRIAHRIVGYLEEEAVHSYTEFLKDIDAGKIENVPAPQIAIDYWRLPKDARLRDVVEVVRADEAHHRDVNHFAATIVREGKKLKDHPAPIDYH